MSKVKISVHVRRHEAFVRKAAYDDQGRMLAKYGLGSAGVWIQVPEGEAYPAECLLSVRWSAWLMPAVAEIRRALQAWLWDRGGELKVLQARCKSFCRGER